MNELVAIGLAMAAIVFFKLWRAEKARADRLAGIVSDYQREQFARKAEEWHNSQEYKDFIAELETKPCACCGNVYDVKAGPWGGMAKNTPLCPTCWDGSTMRNWQDWASRSPDYPKEMKTCPDYPW